MNKKIQVALCGTHGCGKSTLLEGIAQRLNLTKVTDTVVDFWKRKNITDFERLSETERGEFQKELLANQINTERQYADCSFVTDRSVIDYWGYADVCSKMIDRDKELFKMLIQSWCQHNYTHLIYIPLEDHVAYEQRELRAYKESQQAVANSIVQAVTTWVPKEKLTIVSGTVEERLEQAIKFISSPHYSPY